MSKNKNIVLAAGGTGGHIFPAEALAAKLLEHGKQVTLVTDSRYHTHAYTPKKMDIKRISAVRISGGLVGKLKGFIYIAISFLQARKVLKNLKVDVVVGFGGYPSLPTMLAAISLKKKIIIHEQNAVLGRVNRLIAPMSNKIAASLPNTKGVKSSDAGKIVVTGNPVRPAIKNIKDMPYPSFEEGSVFNLLIMGGSQGATVLSEVVPEAIINLPDSIKSNLRIDQQCRAEDIEVVRKKYKEAGVSANLASFFDDIPSRISLSHLVIGRAGASTITELMVAGRPSILVPYKYAMDNHQMENALVIEKASAAKVIAQDDFNSEGLSKLLEGYITNYDKLKEMADRAKKLGNDKADEELAALVMGA